jgi:hypothetical protein
MLAGRFIFEWKVATSLWANKFLTKFAVMPSDILVQLREESTKSLEFTDGEIYRTLRLYQLSQNNAQESKWWGRLASRGRREDIKRLQLNKLLLVSLDRLLPFVGLWKPLKSTQIERLLSLKFPEVKRLFINFIIKYDLTWKQILSRYINLIYERWSRIFQGQYASLLDAASVCSLEGMMPESSLSDRGLITELMETGQIFTHVTRAVDRQAILEGLLSTPGRILSLKTLTQDTLFLDEPAWALRSLFPRFKGISFRKVMRRQWKMAPNRPLEIQKSEHEYITMQHTGNSFPICMMQLWLFALRHFTYRQPRSKVDRRYSIEDYSLANLALLAERLGFQSDQIKNLRNGSAKRAIEKEFIQSICKEEFYNVEDSKLLSVSKQLNGLIRILQRYPEGAVHATDYTTDDPNQEATHRFNKPTRDQYEQQRRYLFLHQIFGSGQPAAQFPTPIGVTRDIMLSFFGNEIDNMQTQETPNNPERIQESPSEPLAQNEQTPNNPNEQTQGTPSEPMAQNEEAATEPIDISQSIIVPNIMAGTSSVIQYQPSMEPDPSTSNFLAGQDTYIGNTSPGAASSQYSRGPDEAIITYDISDPVDMEPHPTGTPDAPSPNAGDIQDLSHRESNWDGVLEPPLAAGFEELSCIAPMETRTFIAGRRRVQDILATWFQSQKEVIVIFEFEFRAYYKYTLGGGLGLRTKLVDLARDYVFAIIDDFGFGTPDINMTYEKAVEKRLLLATRRDNPFSRKRNEGSELRVSVEEIKEYVQTYDIHTGKRKAYHQGPTGKRSRKRKEEHGEEFQGEEEV